MVGRQSWKRDLSDNVWRHRPCVLWDSPFKVVVTRDGICLNGVIDLYQRGLCLTFESLTGFYAGSLMLWEVGWCWKNTCLLQIWVGLFLEIYDLLKSMPTPQPVGVRSLQPINYAVWRTRPYRTVLSNNVIWKPMDFVTNGVGCLLEGGMNPLGESSSKIGNLQEQFFSLCEWTCSFRCYLASQSSKEKCS